MIKFREGDRVKIIQSIPGFGLIKGDEGNIIKINQNYCHEIHFYRLNKTRYKLESNLELIETNYEIY